MTIILSIYFGIALLYTIGTFSEIIEHHYCLEEHRWKHKPITFEIILISCVFGLFWLPILCTGVTLDNNWKD